ncbi:MAG: glycosyltransferase [Acidimicrobiia bacterium]
MAGKSVRLRLRPYSRWATDKIETARKKPWPACDPAAERRRLVAVTVNFNTVDVTRQMLYSIFSSGVIADLDEVVVVDNASKDGSVDYLRVLHDRGLVTLVENRWPPYHGPGINRAMSYLASRDDACATEYVWILDSDVVVLRRDALTAAAAFAREKGLAFVGEKRLDDCLSLYSLLIDPRRFWARSLPVFREHGLPSNRLQQAVTAAGGTRRPFPFSRQHYLLHLGSGTMQAIQSKGLTRNPYIHWMDAEKDRDAPTRYSFADDERATQLYAEFLASFDADARALSPAEFATLLDRLRRQWRDTGPQ